MTILQKRYALVDDVLTQELTTWVEASEAGIDFSDARLRTLPGQVGKYFAVTVVNFLGDLGIFEKYRTESGALNIPHDSNYYSIVDVPLKVGVLLISEEEYAKRIAQQQLEQISNLDAARSASEKILKARQELREQALVKLGLTPEEIAVL
jgi:hypothetical protein